MLFASSSQARLIAVVAALTWDASCTDPATTAVAPPTPIVAAVPDAEPVHQQRSRAARYDLATDERLGGHTLERHVGRTDDQLRERLRREPNIAAASTYADRVVAEEVIARAFSDRSGEVTRWRERRGQRPNLVLEHTEASPIGRSLRRGQRDPLPCDHALVVVRWDERRQSPFVLTSYPECRR